MPTSPWLVHYDAGVPHSLAPYPQKTLVDVVRESAARRPEYTAILFKGRRLTFRDLDRQSDALANGLRRLGVASGERVALLLPNTPHFLIAQLGAWKAGAIVTPLNPQYTGEELIHALRHTGAETVIVMTLFYEKVRSIVPKTDVRNVVATSIKEYLPPLTRFLFTLVQERRDGHRIALAAGDHWFQDVLRRGIDDPAPAGPASSAPAMLMFTGGTTGRPKAALSSHHGLFIAGTQIATWMSSMVEPWSDVNLLLMPLFHTYGNVGVLSAALVTRMIMVPVPNPRDLEDVLNTIEKVKPTFLAGVPTLFIALLNHPRIQQGKVNLSSIKLCLSGASALMAETKRRFEALTGGRIVEGYALTESVMALVLNPVEGVYKPGSVGMPVPDVHVRIVDADDGENELELGQVGEVLLHAPQLMLGYWNQPEETARTVRDGWLYTGDLGYMDEDGYVFIVDRKKDLIKPSGFQVWPREVEEVIAAHPAVREVGVAGVPDPVQVEAVKAWVVLKPGTSLERQELRSFCKERLAAYKVPRQIEFRETLPKSAVGKVLRRELAAEPTASDESP